ncbi:MAG: transglutaminase-like domain-containing protein [Eubacteriales bacterium]
MNKTLQKPRSAEYVLAPESGRVSREAYIVGYILRAAVALAAVFGLAMFFCDAFLIDISPLYAVSASALLCALIAAMCSRPLLRRAGWCVIAIGGAVFVLLTKKPIVFLENSVYSVWNSVMERLSDAGFRALEPITPDKTFSPELLSLGGITLLILTLSVIFCLSLCRRAYLTPVFAFGLTLVIFVFTYNISSSSWYFALIISALCGIIVLKLYDSVYSQRGIDRNRTQNGGKMDKRPARADAQSAFMRYSMGGFAGASACALAFMLLAIPASSIHSRWETNADIDHRLSYFRAVVTSFIVGDEPNMGDMGYLGNLDTLNSRDTSAETRTFTGRPILSVSSSYSTPIYLRSWVGTYYQNNMWYSALPPDVEEYSELFGGDFMPEQIMYDYYDVLDPSLTALNNLTSSASRAALGFITMSVDVKNIASNGNLLFLPTFINPARSLMRYGSVEGEPYASDYTNYYDGILTTGWLNFNKEYRAVASVPYYRNAEYSKVLYYNTLIHDMLVYYIKWYESGDYDVEYIKSQISLKLDALSDIIGELGLKISSPNAFERYIAMSGEEKERFYYNNITLAQSYGDYVERYYTVYPQSYVLENAKRAAVVDMLTQLGDLEIGEDTISFNYLGTKLTYDKAYVMSQAVYSAKPSDSENNGEDIDNSAASGLVDSAIYNLVFPTDNSLVNYVSEHPFEAVKAVVGWLADNCVYTLSPRQPSETGLGAIDAFLSDTHEGYCVQFATSAAMILRSMGLPTRYVEGYIAQSFTRDADMAGRVNRYTSVVRDSNAHAWIEVWFDGIGWMQFETTPPYYSSMYEVFTPGSYTPPTSGSYEPYQPSESVGSAAEPVKKTDYGAIVAGAVSTVVICAVIALVIAVAVTLYKRSAGELERKAQTLSSCLSGRPDEREARFLARTIAGYIYDAYAVAGIKPAHGELPGEFAIRAETEMNAPPDKKGGRRSLTLEQRLKQSEPIPFALVTEAVERELYGGGMTRSQLELCGRFYAALREAVARRTSGANIFFGRHIKRKI